MGIHRVVWGIKDNGPIILCRVTSLLHEQLAKDLLLYCEPKNTPKSIAQWVHSITFKKEEATRFQSSLGSKTDLDRLQGSVAVNLQTDSLGIAKIGFAWQNSPSVYCPCTKQTLTHAGTQLDPCQYHIAGNFQGRKCSQISWFRATHESFPHKIWARRTHQW